MERFPYRKNRGFCTGETKGAFRHRQSSFGRIEKNDESQVTSKTFVRGECGCYTCWSRILWFTQISKISNKPYKNNVVFGKLAFQKQHQSEYVRWGPKKIPAFQDIAAVKCHQIDSERSRLIKNGKDLILPRFMKQFLIGSRIFPCIFLFLAFPPF